MRRILNSLLLLLASAGMASALPGALSQCDVNLDGVTNVADLQAVTNEALGVTRGADDLNGDGAVTVADVQIEINALLNLGCSAVPLLCPRPWFQANTVYGSVLTIGSGTATGVVGPTTETQTIAQYAVSAGKYSSSSPGACAFFSQPNSLVDSAIVQDRVLDSDCTRTMTGSGAGSQPGGYLVFDSVPGTYSMDSTDFVMGSIASACSSGSDSESWRVLWGPWAGVSPPVPLLASSAVLSGTQTFSAEPYDCPACNLPANWEVIWNFSPTPDDAPGHQCKEPNGSEIGCQSQTLGESLPIVGTPFFLHYASDRAAGRAGADTVAIADARSIGGWTINVHHVLEPLLQICGNTCPYAITPKALFLGDGSTRTDSKVQLSVQSNGSTYLTSEDGSEIYAFGAGGLGPHVQTLHALTGAAIYSFAYDSNQRLTSITDASGNATTIQRDANGNPTSIVSPYGQTTILDTDANGYLSQITDPAGNIVKLSTSPDGLLTSMTDANSNSYQFQYDGFGRLLKDADPAGGFTTLARTDGASGYTVTKTTALGRATVYQTASGSSSGTASDNQQYVNTWPNGLQATESESQPSGAVSNNTTLPDGTSASETSGPDPRWGIQVPIPTSATVTFGNLTMNRSASRTASVSDFRNPFSLTSQTDTLTINGRTYTSAFTASNMTFSNTTPVGRQLTSTLDAQERLASTQLSGFLATHLAYDNRGRLAAVTQGARTRTFSYDTNGRLASVTDPLSQTTQFTYDAADNLLSTALPDGRKTSYTYDGNGNLITVTPPNGSKHSFSYTKVNQTSSYTPPGATTGTSYAYNVDRQLTSVTRPDGKSINFNYDSAGRLSSTATPTETINYSYDPATGNLSSASVPGGEGLAYTYNGSLAAGTTWTGPVAGSIAYTHDNNFWLASEKVNGANMVAFTYDNDGLLTAAGAMSIQRSSQNGVIAGNVLGGTTDSRTYNPYGELTGYTASYNGAALYAVQFTTDALGRIAARKETIGASTNTDTYTYDAAGRLTQVGRNGNAAVTYTYDGNSNRLSAVTSSGTVSGTYDAQDRIQTYGGASYTYTANGELASQTTGQQVTTYTYDVLGNLTAVGLPNGMAIGYIVDGRNHRAGKKVNNVQTTGFLYDGDRIAAQLDGSNAVVSQFVYGTRDNSPDYMVQGLQTYRIFSDPLGSPRLIVNTTTGQVMEQIDYDEFGNIVNDTNPGFQPFGFAGGLYDQDTKLLRFGARDYDPKTGRWTAKDPILFRGGDSNLYGYVWNDPVNSVDAHGTCSNSLQVLTSITRFSMARAVAVAIKLATAFQNEAPEAAEEGIAMVRVVEPLLVETVEGEAAALSEETSLVVNAFSSAPAGPPIPGLSFLIPNLDQWIKMNSLDNCRSRTSCGT